MKNLIMTGIRMKLECISDSDGNRKCNHNDDVLRPRINQSHTPDDMHFN